MLFEALVLAHIRRHGLRTLLSLCAIAGAVAIVLVLDVAGKTLIASLTTANATLVENANFSLLGRNGGFDERLLRRVRALPGVSDALPGTQDSIDLTDGRDKTLRLTVRGVDASAPLPHGIDPRAITPGPFVRAGRGPGMDALLDDGVLVSAAVARRFGLRVGSTVRDARDPNVALRVAGVLRGVAGVVDSDVAFVDIATAQRRFGKVGSLDRIDVTVDPTLRRTIATQLRALLRANVAFVEPAKIAAENAAFASDVRADLETFAFLALLVGAVAIANALAISVRARRTEIGILRTLGASRRAIFVTFVREGAVLGALGSLLGLGLGIAIARNTIPHLLTRVDGVSFEFAQALRAFLGGVFAATIAAIVPARSAAGTAPIVAMGARGFEPSFAAPARKLATLSAVLAVGTLIIRTRASLYAGIAAAAGIVPYALIALGTIPRRSRGFGGAAFAIALRDLGATTRRISFAVISLALAIALVTSVAVFAQSFRAALVARAEIALPGDLELSFGSSGSAGIDALVARLAARIRTLPDVTAVDLRARAIVVRTRAGSDSDVDRLRAQLASEPLARHATIENTAELRRALLDRSGATEGAAYGLVLAIFTIALLGVATTFAALVFERRHEIALLRTIGMTARDVGRTMLWTAATVAALAVALGVVLGVLLGVRLIEGTDARAIGATLVPQIPFESIALLVAATIVGALLASVAPARAAARMLAIALVTIALCGRAPVAAQPSTSLAARDGARTQWWRCTGHLAASDGRRLDFTLSIFRYAAFDARSRGSEASRWAEGSTYAATLGITDEGRGIFRQADRLERGALGTARAARDRLSLTVADWRLFAANASPNSPIAVRASTDGARLDLTLEPTKPGFALGDGEVDRPSLRARGTIVVDGRSVAVRGDAWLDTTFGPRATAVGALGWDRFCIELDDGRAMLYERERRADGGFAQTRAVLVDARGRTRPLPILPGSARGGIGKARAGWRSLRTGARYPDIWGLNLPALDMAISLEPVLYEQEIVARGGLPFWSGAVEIFDVRPWSMGARLGRGYVELTGYTRPVELDSWAARSMTKDQLPSSVR